MPTSALSGRGIEELKSAIASLFSDLPQSRDYGKPRLPVDRAFSLKGIGTIVTGTLVGGQLSRGQSVRVQPGGARAHLRAVQSHGKEIATARPGSRVALSLPDVKVATAKDVATGSTVRRGDVIVAADWRLSRAVPYC